MLGYQKKSLYLFIMNLTTSIFFSRATNAVYIIFQFMILYGLLEPDDAATYIFLMMCVGFVPLLDLTLSTNAAAFRESVGTNQEFIASTILVLCLTTTISSVVVCASAASIISDFFLTPDTAIFFCSLCIISAINACLPLFYRCKRYRRVLWSASCCDLGGIAAGVIMLSIDATYILTISILVRLVLLLVSLILIGGRGTLFSIPDAIHWWYSSIRRRQRFLLIQLLSASAGAALFAFPGIFLFSNSTNSDFVSFALGVSLANILVSFLSAFFSAQTSIIAKASFVDMGDGILGRIKRLWFTVGAVMPFFLPLGCMVTVAIWLGADLFGQYTGIRIFESFSLAITVLTMSAGFLHLCAQVIAMGQRIRGFDSFAVSGIVHGVVVIILVTHFGETPVAVALINVIIATSGLIVGSVLIRQSGGDTAVKTV